MKKKKDPKSSTSYFLTYVPNFFVREDVTAIRGGFWGEEVEKHFLKKMQSKWRGRELSANIAFYETFLYDEEKKSDE